MNFSEIRFKKLNNSRLLRKFLNFNFAKFMKLKFGTLKRDGYIPFSKPTIGEDEINEVVDTLTSGWITTGPKTAQFEKNIAHYVQRPNNESLTFNSATAALHLSMLSLDLQPDDEIITTAYTFIATLNTIVQAGAKPVLVDIDPSTYNIDIDQIEAVITAKTRAIVPVHFAGLSVDLDPIYQLAEQHHLRVIEDCAQAIGTQYKGKKLGSFGDTQIFSFHPNKNMTSGEGGALVTNDNHMLDFVKAMRFHGIDRDAFNRFKKEGSQYYDVIHAGFKYNMLDLQAAIGIHQLKQLDGFIEKRTQLAQHYLSELKNISGLTLPKKPKFQHTHSWHLFVIKVDQSITKISRDELMTQLKEHQIGTGLHYQATHLFDFYQQNFGFKAGDFPHAEQLAQQCISLPLYPTLNHTEQDHIITTIKGLLS